MEKNKEDDEERIRAAIQDARIALVAAGEKQSCVTDEMMRLLDGPHLRVDEKARVENAARRLATAMATADRAAPKLWQHLRGQEGLDVVEEVKQAAQELATAAGIVASVVDEIVEGSAELQFQRGFELGKGASPNDVEAVRWIRKAALRNHAKAQNFLGGMYYAGRGVPQNYQIAVDWLTKSAEQGCPDGLRNLGTMYADGLGVETNKVAAYMWLSLAVSAKADYADEYLEKLVATMSEEAIRQGSERVKKRLAAMAEPAASGLLVGGVEGGANKKRNRDAFIRFLIKTRIEADLMARENGFDSTMVDGLDASVVAGMPEATIATIVESYTVLRGKGLKDEEIFWRIEEHRSGLGCEQLSVPLTLESYVLYRLELEYPEVRLSEQLVRLLIARSRAYFQCQSD